MGSGETKLSLAELSFGRKLGLKLILSLKFGIKFDLLTIISCLTSKKAEHQPDRLA